MFSSGFKATKFTTNARLSINRLKLLEKKKTEQAQKARKEIADYLAIGKDERARIRVEHIIREDYLVEAMELVELYLDLLLARLGIIQQMKHAEDSIVEAVSSIIWAAPRLSADVTELKTVSEQLTYKYGKEFADTARREDSDVVNKRLKHKLSVEAPSRRLVESYLVEIARSHKVAYEPDPSILSPPEIEGLLLDLGDETLSGSNKGSGGAGGGGGGIPTHVNLPPQPQPQPQPYAAPPAGQQGYPPAAQAYPHSNPAYPPPVQAYPPQVMPADPTVKPLSPAPPYSENDPLYPPNSQRPGQAPSAPKPENSMPVLPQVPANSFPPLDNSVGGNSAGGQDVDFDDLTRRFEELKKKK